MKSKNAKKSDCFRMKLKVCLNLLVVLVLAPIVVIALVNVFSGKIGACMIGVMQFLFRMDYSEALNMYTVVVRNNSIAILYGAVFLTFVVMVHFSLAWFGKYFDKINEGIDALVDGRQEYITMPPELKHTEEKLNAVRNALEKREEEAVLAEKKKNDLVMYLAHDIKTPLTSVKGYLDLLDENPDLPDEQKNKYVHIALEKANRLEQLINEFFEITRMNQQAMKLNKQNTDLYYMFVQLADEAYPAASSKGNEIEIQVDEDMFIWGDPDKLARAFNNILKNAIAYSEPHSTIAIAAEKRENAVFIAFSNSGTTIPPEKLSAIFDKFYRLDEARTSHTGGSGLGLAIAKEIITLHDGTIGAKSENNVTTFEIMLPAAPDDD